MIDGVNVYLPGANLTVHSLFFIFFLLKDNTAVTALQLRKYGPQSIRNKHIRDMTRISEASLHYKGSVSGSHVTCPKANISGMRLKQNTIFSELDHFPKRFIRILGY